MSSRREFITLLGGAAVWPLAARAQQPGRMYRIGFFGGGLETSSGSRFGVIVMQRFGAMQNELAFLSSLRAVMRRAS